MLESLNTSIRTAETNLNDALKDFEAPTSLLALDFHELKLQACIFQYDICAEMLNLIRNQPTGFAEAVALKGLVLRLYEYNLLLDNHIIPRLVDLSNRRGISFGYADIQTERIKWKVQLKQLRKWDDVRNQAAGHYGKDFHTQVRLLKALSLNEVMTVTQAFLSFNMNLLKTLRNAGRSGSSEPINE